MSIVDEARDFEDEVVRRLRELEPLVNEYEELRQAAQRLGLKLPTASRGKPATARTSAASGRGRARPTTAGRSAKKAGGTRTTRSAGAEAAERAPAERGGTRRTGSVRRRGRAPGTRAARVRPGQRQEDVLRLVRQHPGVTVKELGERLGVDATGLYRVVNRLVADGRVRKEGARLEPIESPAAAP